MGTLPTKLLLAPAAQYCHPLVMEAALLLPWQREAQVEITILLDTQPLPSSSPEDQMGFAFCLDGPRLVIWSRICSAVFQGLLFPNNQGEWPSVVYCKERSWSCQRPASSTFSSQCDLMTPAEWEIAKRGGQFYSPRDHISGHLQGHAQLCMDMWLSDALFFGGASSVHSLGHKEPYYIGHSSQLVSGNSAPSVSVTFRSSSPLLCLCLFLYGPLVASSLMQFHNYHSMHCQHPAFPAPGMSELTQPPSLSLSVSSIPPFLFPFIHSLLFGSMCVSSERL